VFTLSAPDEDFLDCEEDPNSEEEVNIPEADTEAKVSIS
jgi:hypothetical protein